jgi:hypothetical protein
MPRIIFLIIVLLFLTNSYAQKKKPVGKSVMNQGDGFPKNQGYANNYKSFVFKNENFVIDFFINKNDINLRKFNLSTLNLEATNTYELFSKEVSLEKILRIKDRIFLFYSLREGSYNNYKESLYYREIDPNTCLFKEKGKLLFNTDYEVKSVYESNYSSYNNFEIKLSLDSELLAVSYKIDKLKKENAIYCYKVFDTTFNLKWEKDITIPHEVEYVEGVDFSINNMGDIISAFYVYGNKNRYYTDSRLQKDFEVDIYKIEASSDKPYHYRLNIDSLHSVNSVRFTQTTSGVKCVGLSSFIGYNGRHYDPSSVFVFNPQDSTAEIKNHIIPDSIIYNNEKQSKITTDIAIKRRYGESKFRPYVNNLGIERIQVLSDGSILLVAEQSRTVNRSAIVPMATSSVLIVPNFNMLFESAYFIKIEKDGDLAWINKLAKKQETDMQITTDGYNKQGKDMVLIENEDKINVIYTDHIKNLSLDNKKIPKKLGMNKTGVIVNYPINITSGESEKELLSKTNKVNDTKVNNFDMSYFIASDKNSAIFEVTKYYGSNSYLVQFNLIK